MSREELEHLITLADNSEIKIYFVLEKGRYQFTRRIEFIDVDGLAHHLITIDEGKVMYGDGT